MKKRQRKKFPLSGDRLIDGIFLILVDALEKDIEAIYMKDDLRHPNNPKQKLFGFLIHDEGLVFIGKNRHRQYNEPIVQTLIHELLHKVLPHTQHLRIQLLETILWIRLTDNQKRFLRRYIPKHTVKKEPLG